METAEMPKPRKKLIIPKEVWANIKHGFANDIPIEELGLKYGVLAETIRIKSAKECWPRPTRIKQEIARQCAVLEEKLPAPPPPVDWVEAAVNYRTGMLAKLKAAADALSLDSPTTWRDAEIMDRMARKNLGLDDESTKVVIPIIPIGRGDFGVERDVSGSVEH